MVGGRPLDFAISKSCGVSWREMAGTAEQRHCAQCDESVHSLSEMDPDSAAEFLERARAAGEAVCVRVCCDAEGFVVHALLPQLGSPRSRLRLLSPAVLSALLACNVASESDLSLVMEGPPIGSATAHRETSDHVPAKPKGVEASAVDTASGGRDESVHHEAQGEQTPPVMGLLVARPEPPKPARDHAAGVPTHKVAERASDARRFHR